MRYTAIPYGRRFAVQKEDGTLRCIVRNRFFASQIAAECEKEDLNEKRYLQRRRTHPVSCPAARKELL